MSSVSMISGVLLLFFFFFQAEDGIRDLIVTGVQTCALPIFSGHRARLLTRELVENADLILTMARHHRARVDELGGEGRVFVLGEYAGRGGDDVEVSDPFGGNLDIYRETCEELEALAAAVAERLAAESKRGDQR